MVEPFRAEFLGMGCMYDRHLAAGPPLPFATKGKADGSQGEGVGETKQDFDSVPQKGHHVMGSMGTDR